MSYGRTKIFTDATQITKENVAEEVRKAYKTHGRNRNETKKLYEYYRGKTAILSKTKEIRPEINHQICENRAYEIVGFHTGYVFGEPVQYVRREDVKAKKADDMIAADINALNGHMANAGKAACDSKIARWIYISGTGYRLTLPNPEWVKGGDESPVKLYALDPRNTFVVYSNSVDEEPMMGVHYVSRENNEIVFGVYTKDSYFEFKEFGLEVVERTHRLGMIPIVEYPADFSRMGIFEPALPLLDMLNELQSNRMDDIVQFVNSFLAILGGQLDEATAKKLNEYKMLCLPDGVDAKYLSANLTQADIQTMKDDLVQSILEICGVPNRSGSASAGDNGVAVLLRDGYTAAEAVAKTLEESWKEADANFLRLVLRILRETEGTSLKMTDVKAHFTRRNYENIATKSQVLISMLNNPKIHPELAFSHCGMFADAESAYLQSKEYYEAEMKKWQPIEVDENEDEDDVQAS